MKREVLEEAGLECEPDALISVEYRSRSWVRFTFTGVFPRTTSQTYFVRRHNVEWTAIMVDDC